MEEYLSIKEIAEKWGLTPRRVQKMCSEGRLPGAKKFGRDWAIPKDVERPKDARITTGQYKNWRKKVGKKTAGKKQQEKNRGKSSEKEEKWCRGRGIEVEA